MSSHQSAITVSHQNKKKDDNASSFHKSLGVIIWFLDFGNHLTLCEWYWPTRSDHARTQSCIHDNRKDRMSRKGDDSCCWKLKSPIIYWTVNPSWLFDKEAVAEKRNNIREVFEKWSQGKQRDVNVFKSLCVQVSIHFLYRSYTERLQFTLASWHGVLALS